MAIYDDVKITINLNELVEIRAKLISQYDDYSDKVVKGEYLDKGDIDRIAVNLRETLTFDTIFQMIDESILEYLDLNEKNPSTTIETIELTMEKEKKEREKQFKKQFELVSIVNPSWTIEVPRIKR